jgi:hypothetical protein
MGKNNYKILGSILFPLIKTLSKLGPQYIKVRQSIVLYHRIGPNRLRLHRNRRRVGTYLEGGRFGLETCCLVGHQSNVSNANDPRY